jgi:hypothetical protein
MIDALMVTECQYIEAAGDVVGATENDAEGKSMAAHGLRRYGEQQAKRSCPRTMIMLTNLLG